MKKVALLTIIHNTSEDNFDILTKLGSKFDEIYADKFVALSDETLPIWREKFIDLGFKVKIISKRGAAHARREVLKFGLQSKLEHFHYCDYDRLLTWLLNYPDELMDIMNIVKKCDYLIIGRTERAFYTHPQDWRETEKISNKVFSLEYGEEVDITAGSCALSKQSAVAIDQYSCAEMTDAEWPMIIQRFTDGNIKYHEVEGLEYIKKYNETSGDKSESEQWLGRIKLCYLLSHSAIYTGIGDHKKKR